MDDNASVATLREHKSPIILHIATHGYFLRHGDTLAELSSSPAVVIDKLTGMALLRHPLHRCGLVLAGANAWLVGADKKRTAADSLLTAADAIELDLKGTEMVVLSACETGLGDVVSTKGVVGLRRMFAIAGARTVVASLWKVPDEATRALMEAFYKYLIGGTPRSEALRKAKVDTRATHPHPMNWAGFICLGDGGPLEEIRCGASSYESK